MLARALGAGIVAAVGLTFGRWLTWEPYPPVLMYWDTVLIALPLVAWLTLLNKIQSGRLSETMLSLMAALPVVIFYVGLWADALRELSAALSVIAVLLLVGAVFLVYRHARKAGRIGMSFESFSLTLGSAFAISLWSSTYLSVFALLLPVTLLLLLARGVPGHRIAVPGYIGTGVVTVFVFIICALTIRPDSGEQVGAPYLEDGAPGHSVILIVLDTLRRDHLSLYGYERKTTPQLDAWSEDARVFSAAVSASSWTLPSHASMFTGQYPRTHGAHGYRGSKALGNAYPLPDKQETLAEIAWEKGVVTGAIISNWIFLSPDLNLDQGFDTYWVKQPKFTNRGTGIAVFRPGEWLAQKFSADSYEQYIWSYYRDSHITDSAIRWLSQVDGNQFFLFLNYMDVHGPNRRPPNEVVPLSDEQPASKGAVKLLIEMLDKPINQAYQNYLVNAYDRELLHLDAELARLLRFIDTSGLGKNTTVIITSDHGEYFGEHRLLGHSKNLHGEVTHVPFIVKGPNIEPGRTDKPVHGIDVFPTVLELLDIDPPDQTPAHSIIDQEASRLVSEWYPSVISAERSPELEGRYDRVVRALWDSGLKLLHTERGESELFDLDNDPDELQDIAAERAAETAVLVDDLNSWLATTPEADHARLDSDAISQPETNQEIQRLRGLGYVD
ncbi:MAG: sulfatase [Gammaproteobacteria bacterium]|nr:sulfatase [Gammaproteobacteria bacterium]MDP6617518.1 sulfatase [Gammaproteobacteria bacterium]MDP6694395.1 sulfatase [Gammaproteobacteria bacterium]